jgi:hypothetical protein
MLARYPNVFIFLIKGEDESELLCVSKREAMARMGSIKQRSEKGRLGILFDIWAKAAAMWSV